MWVTLHVPGDAAAAARADLDAGGGRAGGAVAWAKGDVIGCLLTPLPPAPAAAGRRRRRACRRRGHDRRGRGRRAAERGGGRGKVSFTRNGVALDGATVEIDAAAVRERAARGGFFPLLVAPRAPRPPPAGAPLPIPRAPSRRRARA